MGALGYKGKKIMKMTPVQTFEYKLNWMSSGRSNPVKYHSDWRSQAMEFCKKNFGKRYWHFAKFTGVYEDTMYFEHANHAEFFADYMEVTAAPRDGS
jgi:hypothetical protein